MVTRLVLQYADFLLENPQTESQVRITTRCLVDAVAYLHEKGIIHGQIHVIFTSSWQRTNINVHCSSIVFICVIKVILTRWC